MYERRLLAAAFLLHAGALAAQTPKYTIAQFLSPASPLEVAAARKADRIAWVSYENGLRNVYVASAPLYRAVRITRFLNDDGIDLGSIRLSDDGLIATFVRGHSQNSQGWVANPSADPDGADRAVWAARTDGTGAWRLASVANTPGLAGGGGGGGGGGAPEPSPDGRYVVFVRDGQIYRASTARGPRSAMDTAGVPFVKAWGRQTRPTWSPDGRKLAFVSLREHHSLLGIYDMATRTVSYIAPSTDFDNSPAWSPDSKQIAFIRRPGTPFGQQTPQGGAFGQAATPGNIPAGRGCRPSGGGGGGGGGFGIPVADTVPADGLCRAAFAGGHTISFMVADIATGATREFWRNRPMDRKFVAINNIVWAGDHVVFTANIPGDEWDRYFSVSVSTPQSEPVLLTTTDGLINDGVAGRSFTTTAVSRDGKTLFYATNANDIESRNIWAVPVAGGTPTRLTSDAGVEVSPTPLASGRDIAVLYFGADQPASIGIVPAAGGETRVVWPTLPAEFPRAAHVTPEIVKFKSPDGLEISNQLFLPKDLKPGEKRPAVVFVHGGPARQMLPAYHYMQFYHWSYAYNQWLQTQGYIVLSINYRLGIGYGNSFRRAANTRTQGNAEYQDVLAGARYLQGRADVDPSRIGIWGLSYGGLLVAQALARNSDVFVAGVDLAGVHIYGSASDTTTLAFRSSAVGSIDKWKSPVYLQHGDDDRNVDFAQTVGLVSLLRARGVYYELEVTTDDVHESLIHKRMLYTFDKSNDFLRRFVWEKQPPPAVSNPGAR